MAIGSQREARMNRLKDEIRQYVELNPNCSAAAIDFYHFEQTSIGFPILQYALLLIYSYPKPFIKS